MNLIFQLLHFDIRKEQQSGGANMPVEAALPPL
jgi:hypothetical protein